MENLLDTCCICLVKFAHEEGIAFNFPPFRADENKAGFEGRTCYCRTCLSAKINEMQDAVLFAAEMLEDGHFNTDEEMFDSKHISKAHGALMRHIA